MVASDTTTAMTTTPGAWKLCVATTRAAAKLRCDVPSAISSRRWSPNTPPRIHPMVKAPAMNSRDASACSDDADHDRKIERARQYH